MSCLGFLVRFWRLHFLLCLLAAFPVHAATVSEMQSVSLRIQDRVTTTVVNKIMSEEVPAGWTFSRPYKVGSQQFAFTLRRHSGYLEIYDFTQGELGDQVRVHFVEPGWTSAEIHQVGQVPYLILSNAENGKVRKYRIEGDGSLASFEEFDGSDWRGKYLVRTYSQGDSNFLFGLDPWTGEGVQYTLDGALVSRLQWTKGWTSLDFIEIEDRTYRLRYKRSDYPGGEGGSLCIERITADGEPAVIIYQSLDARDAGWSHVRFLTMKRRWPREPERYFVFFYDESSGVMKAIQFDPEAGLGSNILEGKFGSGWTQISPFQLGTRLLLLTSKEDSFPRLSTQRRERFIESVRSDLQGRVPGYQLTLAQSGHLIHQEAWGGAQLESDDSIRLPMSVDALVNLGSVSKMITTVSILKLVDWGEIDLDAPITNYLDPHRYDFHDSIRGVSIRDLLQHTSALKGDCRGTSSVTTMDCSRILESPRLEEDCIEDPDNPSHRLCRRDYENGNFSILRLVLESFSYTESSKGFVDLTRRLWLNQIGLTGVSCVGPGGPRPESVYYYNANGSQDGQVLWNDGTWTPGATSWFCGSGGWKASSRDMLRFLRALRYQEFLSPAMTEVLFDTTLRDSNGGRTAISWEPLWRGALGKGGSLSPTGGGLSTQIYHFPEGIDAVLLFNTHRRSSNISAKQALKRAWERSKP